VGAPSHSVQIIRFATFEVDRRAGETRKSGLKLKLTGQPFEVLSILLERPGEVVTRISASFCSSNSADKGRHVCTNVHILTRELSMGPG
jgi:DNA-binding response OmpR family regulator